MSKTNKMLIDASHPEETRVVVVRDGRVEEFDFESASRKPLRGNIYLAKITRVEPSLQAAFVEYGGNRHGFLAFSEIHPDYYQIPMADRIALLEEEAAQEAAEEAEADAHAERLAKRRSRQGADGDGDEPRDSGGRETQARDGQSRDGRGRGGRGRDGRGRDGRRNNRGGRARPAAASSDEADVDAGGTITEVPVGDHYEPIDPHDNAHDGDLRGHHDHPHDDDHHPHADHPHAAALEHRHTASEDRTLDDKYVADGDGQSVEAETIRPATLAAAVHGASDALFEEVSEATVVASGSVQADDLDGRDPDDDDGEDDDGEPDRDDDDAQVASAGIDDDGRDLVDGAALEIDVIEPDGLEDLVEEVPQRPRRRMRSYKIQEVIKRRQVVLIQVVKEERGNKGAALTTYLSLAGRYTVLMPNTARGGGISRKITNPSDRKRLKSAAQALDVPEGMGLIVRTAGAAREAQDIKRDFEYLLRLWENVRELTLQSTAPTLVYEEGNLIKRSIRDLYNKDIDEIVVAGETGYREANDFMRMLSPSQVRNVVHYDSHEPLLARYRVEQQLAALFSPQVTLRSGGYIVINQTEALVAIDVNSGKSTREYSIEETALNTNLEAAEEVARQVKLRDLAGLIVIDFIDMEEKRNNRSVERCLKDSLRNDRARIQLGRISHFGLMEMSRQRLRTGVVEGSTSQCPHCEGTGIIRSIESISLAVLRGIEDALMGGTRMALIAYTTPQVALYILNSKRGYIIDMEARHGLSISVQGSDKLQGANFTIEKVAAAIEPIRRRAVATPVNMEWGFDDSDDQPVARDVDVADIRDDGDRDDTRLDARSNGAGAARASEGRSSDARSGEGRSTEGRSTEGRSTEGRSNEGRSTEGRSTEGRAEDGSDGEAGGRRRRRRGRRGRRDEPGVNPSRAVVDDYGTQPVGGYDGEEPTAGEIDVGGAHDGDDLDNAAEANGTSRGPIDREGSVEDGEVDADGRPRRGRRRGRRGGRRGQGADRLAERGGERNPAQAEATANGTVMAYLEDGSLAPVADTHAVHGDVPGASHDSPARRGATHQTALIHGDDGAAHATNGAGLSNEVKAHASAVDVTAAAEHPSHPVVSDDHAPSAAAAMAVTAPMMVPVFGAPIAAVRVLAAAIVAQEPPKPRRTTTSSEPVIERVVVGTGDVAEPEPTPAPQRRGWWQRKG